MTYQDAGMIDTGLRKIDLRPSNLRPTVIRSGNLDDRTFTIDPKTSVKSKLDKVFNP